MKIRFFPANTTSVLQPLDQGIIPNMKCHYRSKVLRVVLCKMESSLAASEIAKSFTVLDACLWIKLSLKQPLYEITSEKPVSINSGMKFQTMNQLQRTVDEEVLQQHITSLGLPQSADAANYIAYESAPTTEVLEKGWRMTCWTNLFQREIKNLPIRIVIAKSTRMKKW